MITRQIAVYMTAEISPLVSHLIIRRLRGVFFGFVDNGFSLCRKPLSAVLKAALSSAESRYQQNGEMPLGFE